MKAYKQLKLDLAVQKNRVKKLKEENKGMVLDVKSFLQEWYQDKQKITPTYKVLEETGEDHEKTFTSGVFIEEVCLGKGTSTSIKKSQKLAATEALHHILTK